MVANALRVAASSPLKRRVTSASTISRSTTTSTAAAPTTIAGVPMRPRLTSA
ncbi:hypothetical protein ABT369_00130 [Dactylosporangium sp. NPDC000244]|uniref:hypothetical protein n=1 Tax=Dactylosporangium sp. NPDC000244 TaxID=3154365 RepID=UPI003317C138